MILSPGITFLPLVAQLPVVILHGSVSSLGPCLSLPLYHMLLKGRGCVWSCRTFVGPSVWGPIQNENGKSRFKNDKEFQDGNNSALNQAQVLLSTVPFADAQTAHPRSWAARTEPVQRRGPVDVCHTNGWISKHSSSLYRKIRSPAAKTFILIIDVRLHKPTLNGVWTAGSAHSCRAAGAGGSWCYTSSSLSGDLGHHPGLSNLLAGARLLPASPVSVPPVALPLLFQLSPNTEHSEECQPLWTLPPINNPWLCQTGHWGEATKPPFSLVTYIATGSMDCAFCKSRGKRYYDNSSWSCRDAKHLLKKSSLTHMANGLH